MSALVCGLKVHKESTYATILDQYGVIVTQKRMPNEEIPAFLRPHEVEKVAMEASTSITPLYQKLTEEGYDVIVSHPRKTRYIARAIKSDRVDFKAMAELLRLNSLPESYMPPPHIAMLREKVRRRAFLVRQRTKLKVKIGESSPTRASNPQRNTACTPGRGGSGSKDWGWSPSAATSG